MTFSWNGPELAEEEATFLNYKMEVSFTDPDGENIVVPGYFAADGNAGESGAEKGRVWRAHLLPLKPGKWSYTVSFLEGENMAIAPGNAEGRSLAFDGEQGTFTVSPEDPSQGGFLGKGKLQYIGEHFLQFTNGEYFLKWVPMRRKFYSNTKNLTELIQIGHIINTLLIGKRGTCFGRKIKAKGS